MILPDKDEQYFGIARLLITLELTSGNKNVIATLGFYLALHKQGLFIDSNYLEDYHFIYNQPLELDCNHTIMLQDVCSMRPIDSHLHSFARTICVIENLDHAKLFETIIYIYASEDGGKRGEFYQPLEVTHLVTELLKSRNVKLVYNPFAGIASYQLNNVSAHYYSQEINESTWVIGKIRLLISGIETDYVCEDSISQWKGDSEKFDAIVATTPFGSLIQREERLSYPFSKRTSAEEFFIYKGLGSINERGVLIGIFSTGVLFKGGLIGDIRRDIIERDLLDTVITLPRNTFPNTSISTVVVILSKRKKNLGYVKMVDGSSFFTKDGRCCIVKWEDIFHITEKSEGKYAKLIANEVIEANDYDFSAARYINDVSKTVYVPDGFELIKLKELVVNHRGNRSKTGKFRLVKGKDLANDRFSFDKTFKELPIEDTNNQFSALDRDLLLLLRIGKPKPTFFHYTDGIDVCCNQNILSFEFRKDKVYPPYLVNELGKEYVEKQIVARSTGVAMQSITLKDLLEIEVLLPTFEKQEKIFDEEKSVYQEHKIKELGLEVGLLKVSQHTEFERNMRLRKHALTQVLGDFSSAFSMISKCKEKHNGTLKDSDIVSSRTGETVADYFRKLPKYVAKVEGLIDALVDRQTYGEPEYIYLHEFFEAYKREHLADNYSIRLDVHSTDGDYWDGDIEYDSNLRITICRQDLIQVMDNIVNNARKYGFVDKSRGDYEIWITVGELTSLNTENGKDEVFISVKNNGNSLSKTIDMEKFFHWGIGEGTGIGTWQIKNIVEQYGGRVTIDDPSEYYPSYTIEYELIFPLS